MVKSIGHISRLEPLTHWTTQTLCWRHANWAMRSLNFIILHTSSPAGLNGTLHPNSPRRRGDWRHVAQQPRLRLASYCTRSGSTNKKRISGSATCDQLMSLWHTTRQCDVTRARAPSNVATPIISPTLISLIDDSAVLMIGPVVRA